MFAVIDETLRNIAGGGLAAYSLALERVLVAHQRQALLLWLSPADINRIAGEAQLGVLARVTLEHILRKSADYQQALNRSERTIVLCADGAVATPFEVRGSTVRIELNRFAREFADHRHGLFVEDASSDGRTIQGLYELYCAAERLPSGTTKFWLRHGGGSGLCGLLESLEPNELLGLCLCDPDIPPSGAYAMKPGGTASSALNVCAELNVMAKGETGYSSAHPLFAFDLVGARTLEGLIGPRLLDSYFAANPQARTVRAEFAELMPRFPRLTEEQYILWMSTNLKDGNAERDELVEALLHRAPGAQVPSQSWLTRFARLSVPGNVLAWVGENSRAGRHLRENVEAMRFDLRSNVYHNALGKLVRMSWTMLAADASFRLT